MGSHDIRKTKGLPSSNIPPAKWKPGAGASCKELRQKYRPVKGLRRRMRKSVEGSSIMLVSSKQLSRCRKMAEGKGLGFAHLGSHPSGHARVKLIGSDGAIDEVAKAFGRPLRGVKSMPKGKGFAEDKAREDKAYKEGYQSQKQGVPIQRNPYPQSDPGRYTAWNAGWEDARDGNPPQVKSMSSDKDAMYREALNKLRGYVNTASEVFRRQAWDRLSSLGMDLDLVPKNEDGARRLIAQIEQMGIKSMRTKTKDLDLAAEAPPEQAQQEDTSPVEPFSSQILRRMHEDTSILMQEYDEWMPQLEHEHVKGHLQSKLETLAKELDDLEALHKKHHKDLPGLGGGDDEEEDEDGLDAEEKDLEEEEAPDEEGAAGEEEETSEEATEAASGAREEEEPTPDEAFEGMEGDEEPEKEEKGLRPVTASKSLRGKYSKAFGEEYELAYRIPGAGGWKRKVFKTDVDRQRFVEKLIEKEGDDVEVQYRDPEKALRNGKKAVCPECGKEDCSCQKALRNGKKGLTEGDRAKVGEAIRATWTPPKKPAGTAKPKPPPGREIAVHRHGKKDLTEDELQEIEGQLEGQMDDTEPEEKQLEPHHKEAIRDAHGFLTEISQAQDFGDEHRMKAYHHHANLSGVVKGLGGALAGGAVGAMVAGPAGAVAGAGAGHVLQDAASDDKGMNGEAKAGGQYIRSGGGHSGGSGGTYIRQPVVHVPTSNKSMGWHKALSDASSFLGELSTTRDFGDPHRQKAMMHCKALEPFTKEDEPEAEEEVMEDQEETLEPGEMGEKTHQPGYLVRAAQRDISKRRAQAGASQRREAQKPPKPKPQQAEVPGHHRSLDEATVVAKSFENTQQAIDQLNQRMASLHLVAK